MNLRCSDMRATKKATIWRIIVAVSCGSSFNVVIEVRARGFGSVPGKCKEFSASFLTQPATQLHNKHSTRCALTFRCCVTSPLHYGSQTALVASLGMKTLFPSNCRFTVITIYYPGLVQQVNKWMQ
jgi:hypothetical protein